MKPPGIAACAAAAALLAALGLGPALADGPLTKVNHIVVVMQENHSFDNYFGVLPYAPGGPYHPAKPFCAATDHACIDGLSCIITGGGALKCTNHNVSSSGAFIYSYHAGSRCTNPDLDHSWLGTHLGLNFIQPNASLAHPLNNGFVRDNQDDPEPMSYFDQTDIPFYYRLAQTFAVSDRQFAAVVGPTIPNRFYLMAATSFGHLTTEDTVPPPDGGYKPVNGSIFDLLNKNNISWADYFEDAPQAIDFGVLDAHDQQIAQFYLAASGLYGSLPQVAFIDPDFGVEGTSVEDDEHPPTDIQRGQWHVSDVVNAIRNGPYWKDTIILITYDEHGGFYDHAKPPAAPQGGARTPDGVYPGQCEDLSNPPGSLQPGGGAECATNPISQTDTSVLDAEALCPQLKANPTGPYPTQCAAFNQEGVRVPLIAVSPFSKPAYVSHTVRDHTAILALIEKRFLGGAHLTARDGAAASLEELFDFTNAPSMHAAVGSAGAPAQDCTP
jgi:phospholipase C